MDLSDLVRMFGYGASPDAGFSLPPDYSGLVQSGQTGTADPTRAGLSSPSLSAGGATSPSERY
jgi:hypothetical protein